MNTNQFLCIANLKPEPTAMTSINEALDKLKDDQDKDVAFYASSFAS